jgi:hypothetical protein
MADNDQKPMKFEVILNIESDIGSMNKSDWEYLKSIFGHRSESFVQDLFAASGVESKLQVTGKINMVMLPPASNLGSENG